MPLAKPSGEALPAAPATKGLGQGLKDAVLYQPLYLTLNPKNPKPALYLGSRLEEPAWVAF